ncbi:hypothetical protein VFPPC_15889 [Pochonia chlamydosporia 170]|uniref:Uncharacterized protein n=1 Tax=Pochonia chlamydosporia 170 TaxID=1380566 RepID=A0A179FTE0_METCM|nr:hypothetical protein VFPPC_15889 [Pochonia chlamydosporia 170]OAQ68872.1 hypothetical protein VFPPC_15889 [Pochonia chlamydosporia 170]
MPVPFNLQAPMACTEGAETPVFIGHPTHRIYLGVLHLLLFPCLMSKQSQPTPISRCPDCKVTMVSVVAGSAPIFWVAWLEYSDSQRESGFISCVSACSSRFNKKRHLGMASFQTPMFWHHIYSVTIHQEIPPPGSFLVSY